jgi:hypothetical protein
MRASGPGQAAAQEARPRRSGLGRSGLGRSGLGRSGSQRSGAVLARLFGVSRRVPAALVVIAACSAGLRIALIAHWDAYGALQLPLIFEVGAVVAVTATVASPFGDPERVAGGRLPFLRLAVALAMTLIAAGTLALAGTGANLAGGTLDVLRNVAGMTGIGMLFAAALGGALGWTGPVGYLVLGVYAIYTQWHGPALTTPWLWPARPPHDLGAAICACLVLATGTAVVTVRGARDPAGE